MLYENEVENIYRQFAFRGPNPLRCGPRVSDAREGRLLDGIRGFGVYGGQEALTSDGVENDEPLALAGRLASGVVTVDAVPGLEGPMVCVDV